MKDMTLTEARNRLLKIADQIERNPRTVVEVTKRGRRVMALLSAQLYDSLVETLEILGDDSTAAQLRRSLKEIERGEGIPWKTARKQLGLEE